MQQHITRTKILADVALLSLTLKVAPLCLAQGTFGNLDFESATVPSVPPDQAVLINATEGFPNWTVYIGSQQASQVWYNGISLGGALVGLIDRHTAVYGNEVIQGNFTASLDSGLVSIGGTLVPVSAALAQIGFIPVDAHTLLFGASQNVSALSLAFNGQDLPFVRLASGSNYGLYGADISRIAGLAGELRFTETPLPSSNFQIAYLDNILFSTTSIPEPAVLGFGGLGAAVVLVQALRRNGSDR